MNKSRAGQITLGNEGNTGNDLVKKQKLFGHEARWWPLCDSEATCDYCRRLQRHRWLVDAFSHICITHHPHTAKQAGPKCGTEHPASPTAILPATRRRRSATSDLRSHPSHHRARGRSTEFADVSTFWTALHHLAAGPQGFSARLDKLALSASAGESLLWWVERALRSIEVGWCTSSMEAYTQSCMIAPALGLHTHLAKKDLKSQLIFVADVNVIVWRLYKFAVLSPQISQQIVSILPGQFFISNCFSLQRYQIQLSSTLRSLQAGVLEHHDLRAQSSRSVTSVHALSALPLSWNNFTQKDIYMDTRHWTCTFSWWHAAAHSCQYSRKRPCPCHCLCHRKAMAKQRICNRIHVFFTCSPWLSCLFTWIWQAVKVPCQKYYNVWFFITNRA